MRVLPHHDDTGGFFIAVLEKMADMPEGWEQPKKLRGPITVRTDLTVVGGEVKVSLSLVNLFELRDERAAQAANGGKPLEPEKELLLDSIRGGGRRGNSDGGRGFGGLDPVLPVSDPKVIDSICDTYGIEREKLPLHKNAVTRTADNTRPKRIYLLTDGLREYLAADVRESLKVIAAGLKIFERQEHKDTTGPGAGTCDFRLVQDGKGGVCPFIHSPTYSLTHSLTPRASLLEAQRCFFSLLITRQYEVINTVHHVFFGRAPPQQLRASTGERIINVNGMSGRERANPASRVAHDAPVRAQANHSPHAGGAEAHLTAPVVAVGDGSRATRAGGVFRPSHQGGGVGERGGELRVFAQDRDSGG